MKRIHIIHKWKDAEKFENDDVTFIIQKCSKCNNKRILASIGGSRYRQLYGYTYHEAVLYMRDMHMVHTIY